MRGREDRGRWLQAAELRYEYGFTLREIGAEMGIGAPTVHSLLRRHADWTQLGPAA